MTALIPPAPAPEEIEYPSGDDEPMAETPVHVFAIMLLLQALQDFFHDRTDMYLSGNSFWYWQEGNPNARVAPDTMVVFGVTQKRRRSFMSWKEGGAVPCAIVEVCSEKNWRENLNDKRRLYAELGVREYFLFDPEGAYLKPALRGFRLQDGNYTELAPDENGHLRSEQLGVLLRPEGEMLRLFDARTGEPVLTRQERANLAERQAESAQQEAESAQREVESAQREAKSAQLLAKTAQQLAEQERQRAAALEAEVARLRALLQQGQGQKGNGSHSQE